MGSGYLCGWKQEQLNLAAAPALGGLPRSQGPARLSGGLPASWGPTRLLERPCEGCLQSVSSSPLVSHPQQVLADRLLCTTHLPFLLTPDDSSSDWTRSPEPEPWLGLQPLPHFRICSPASLCFSLPNFTDCEKKLCLSHGRLWLAPNPPSLYCLDSCPSPV